MDYQTEVKLICENREFSLYNVNSQIKKRSYTSLWKVFILFHIRQLYVYVYMLYVYYLEILHLILLNIWSYFHAIGPFFKHLYYFFIYWCLCLYLCIFLTYSFIYSFIIYRETGSINKWQRSLFIWTEFLHYITVTSSICAHRLYHLCVFQSGGLHAVNRGWRFFYWEPLHS